MNLKIKAIIDGKRYNTETATKIGEASFGARTDFKAWEASLFRTPRGNYFLAGRGGPMSPFSQRLSDGSYTSSSRIIPLTEQEAKEWAEKYLDDAIVEKFFGDQ